MLAPGRLGARSPLHLGPTAHSTQICPHFGLHSTVFLLLQMPLARLRTPPSRETQRDVDGTMGPSAVREGIGKGSDTLKFQFKGN